MESERKREQVCRRMFAPCRDPRAAVQRASSLAVRSAAGPDVAALTSLGAERNARAEFETAVTLGTGCEEGAMGGARRQAHNAHTWARGKHR